MNFNNLVGDDIMNIVNEYKEQFEYLENVERHKETFEECLSNIRFNGLKKDMENELGRYGLLCGLDGYLNGYVNYGDYGSFRDFCRSRLECGLEDYMEENVDYIMEELDIEEDDFENNEEDIEQLFIDNNLDSEWIEFENDSDMVIDILDKYYGLSEDDMDNFREYCIDNGYY